MTVTLPPPEVPPPADDEAPETPTVKRGRKPAKRVAAAAPARGPGRPSNAAKLEERVAKEIAAIGLGLSVLGAARGSEPVAADGQVVCKYADELAAALVECAETSPALKKILSTGIESSGWLGVAMVVGSMGRDIYMNHTATPADVEPVNPFAGVPTASPPAWTPQ